MTTVTTMKTVATALSSVAPAAADIAVDALLAEARLTPKPGLVDGAGTGAHDDMDLALLERSARALRPWFAACWHAGYDAPGQVEPLVAIGVAAEADLAVVTGGVNTHRGALFALGLILGALGAEAVERGVAGPSYTEPLGVPLPQLLNRVAQLATPLLDAWVGRSGRCASHGGAALRDLGLTGARGEAASGFATVTSSGLPAYRARLSRTDDENDALRWALVSLMAHNADTNLVHRGGAAGLAFVRDWALEVLRRNPAPDALIRELVAADAAFTRRRLSPGGSADLLAVTWLLDRFDQLGRHAPTADARR